jgi:hypothetical protein
MYYIPFSRLRSMFYGQSQQILCRTVNVAANSLAHHVSGGRRRLSSGGDEYGFDAASDLQCPKRPQAGTPANKQSRYGRLGPAVVYA